MASLLSPGVLTREIDLTTVVPAGASSEGAIVLTAHWGPVNKIVSITSEIDLVDSFGKPSNDNAEGWFTAKNFLSYSGSLFAVRVVSGDALNSASDGSSDVLIRNLDDIGNYSGVKKISAKYPGKIGDSLEVWISDSVSWAASSSPYKELFGKSPLDYDELHVLVIDRGGLFSGVKGTVLEKYEYLSKTSDAKKEDGTSNYYKKVINDSSEYILILNELSPEWGKKFDDVLESVNGMLTLRAGVVQGDWELSSPTSEELAGGSDGAMTSSETLGIKQTGYDTFFSDDEFIDISFLLGADADENLASTLLDIASSRKDCIAVISPRYDDVVGSSDPTLSIKNYRENSLSLGGLKDLKSSYIVMDDNWKYQFDKYNNVFRWVPCNGDTAGLMAETDSERAPWFSPGGRSLKNVTKLAWKSKRSERDILYPLGINSIATFPGEGAILFGDRTMLQRPSAFDRINVRRLFIYLRKIISAASRSFLFENNTEYTRRRFVNIVEPVLREIQARQGITDFKVVCDSTNNPGNVIDQNRFIGDIYIKPARSINFVELNFVAVRTDVEFSEVVGSL